MIHVGYVDEFAEADDLIMFLVDALVSLQEILGPVKAHVSVTTFRNADGIIRIIRIIDLNQPLVVAGLELSEPEGESPLLTHGTRARPSAQQIVYSPKRLSPVDILWMTGSFCASSTKAVFQVRSFVTGVIFVLPGSSYHVIRGMRPRTYWVVKIRRFAIVSGAPSRYHDTLTRFWVRLVSHAMEYSPGVRNIDDLLAMFPL